MVSRHSFQRFLNYCGIEKEDYNVVRPLIWKRNIRTLRITSILAIAMGLLFLAVNILTGTGLWLPYLFLFCGSLVILTILLLLQERGIGESAAMILCYAQMILVCSYATILSTQPSNYAVPATSVIVFISLLPLSIDDRPIRMYIVMLLESAAYLSISYLAKSPDSFSLDIINVLTFCVVGMILYAVIVLRNVREIYQSVRVEEIQGNIITTLATVVEERDESTGGHIQRTEDYVSALIDQMRATGRYPSLTDEYCKNVILAAPMHDIGKIRIPDSILNKPGRLTEEEYDIMKNHSAYGGDIISKTMANIREKEYCDIAFNIARYHHERYDGGGYPDGLKGEEIPLEARIMALADVYDALVSKRVYKKAFSKEKARSIIAENSGTQFDPELSELFLKCVDKQ